MLQNRPMRLPLERENICFLGTSVESGSALGVVARLAKTRTWGAWPARSSASKRKQASIAA